MTSLKDRFDKAGVVEALLRQRLVRNDEDLAQKFADAGRVVECAPGEVLIEQGGVGGQVAAPAAQPVLEVALKVQGQSR